MRKKTSKENMNESQEKCSLILFALVYERKDFVSIGHTCMKQQTVHSLTLEMSVPVANFSYQHVS